MLNITKKLIRSFMQNTYEIKENTENEVLKLVTDEYCEDEKNKNIEFILKDSGNTLYIRKGDFMIPLDEHENFMKIIKSEILPTILSILIKSCISAIF